ncbi:Sulfate and thiosulfate import ATP-binding protein CysA [Lysobacter dokdonensis DS-58]|uniref:Sulfate and thiosulfate import ATP-binding protein CysA n=1 Tax=Lysobacter dokdonensis DS-58 TaxID=1300345 RepID=A0A0A2WZT2_9GAMM|nr:sulfate/molybdate ABC transporter ATP-binding protein [Lysobacter dokdonensis]KGQ18499.1 Sulfate and thiosulfate import ATP-binding protein CysA [Lysobacter dokdonensis DS-58]
MDLHLKGISKHYPGVAALDGVDLDIASGELVALLGPSGSGKTTLLRVIAGLLHPDAGTLHFGETDATSMRLRQRNVGFVFQQYALFRHMTVAENIAFGLRSRPRSQRPPKVEIAKRVEELLALIQLPELGTRYPDQLSGGQKQRVALARALAIKPNVLLLDEPFGALDTKVRVELRRWLRRLHERTGQTTLFVTHDQEEALELADRVVVMRDGGIEQVASVEDIHRAPASPFVFEFIGRANRIEGQVHDGVFRMAGQSLALPMEGDYTGAAILMTRPHELAIVNEGDGFAAKVVDLFRRADRITVELECAGQPRTMELDLGDAQQAQVPRVGDVVRVRPMRAAVYPDAR